MTPSDDLLKRWARVEAHLRETLTLVDIDAQARRWAEEFLDHNELGLAFQTVVGALVDGGTTPPSAAQAHLGAAASEMGLQDDADWTRLNSPID